jgi:hypothetical protein
MIDKIILIHPLLFSFIFVISPYAQYDELIPATQIFRPLIILYAITLISFLLIKLMTKNEGISVAILSPFLMIFCNYGVMYDAMSQYLRGTKLHAVVVVISIIVILIVMILYIIRIIRAHADAIKKVNTGFCIVAVCLFIYNIFISTIDMADPTKIKEANFFSVSSNKNENRTLPDIYFIILDEYAAPSQMKSLFRYDMTPFVKQLKQKGFIITEMKTESLDTAVILDEILNMEEKKNRKNLLSSSNSFSSSLDSIGLINSAVLQRMVDIRDNKVVRFLKNHGYQFINMGSWYTPTRYNQRADVNRNFWGFQLEEELSTIIVQNSCLRLIFINKTHSFHRKAILEAFSALEHSFENSGKPNFIFAHIICPHTPYIFGANGETISESPTDINVKKQLYLAQHIFITKEVNTLVNHIMSNSRPHPLIIIQSDHGFRLDKDSAHKTFSAVFIPSVKTTPWPDNIHSYNTFRIIFNTLFNEKMER